MSGRRRLDVAYYWQRLYHEGQWAVGQPGWLMLLAVLPLFLLSARGGLSGLTPKRKRWAVALRSLLVLLLILALADLQWQTLSKHQCTMFVIDRSQSVPQDKQQVVLDAINSGVARRQEDEDQAGLIIFGDRARLERSPMRFPRDRPFVRLTIPVDGQASNLASGVKLAQASFPPGASRRIVLVSDGNENMGDVYQQARSAQQAGVVIDVIPLDFEYTAEVVAERLRLPPRLAEGEPASVRIALRATHATTGKIQLIRKGGGQTADIPDMKVTLRPGLNVFSIPQMLTKPGLYFFEAGFIPDNPADDQNSRNNWVSGITWVQGERRVLVLHQPGELGDYQALSAVLSKAKISTQFSTADGLSRRLSELPRYDAVIVGNVPAEQLTEDLQKALVSYCERQGGGLVVVGGPQSYAAGGYRNSPLARALPVELDPPSKEQRSQAALVMIMHACEIADGTAIQRKIARLTVQKLDYYDECGTLTWNGQVRWLFGLQPRRNGALMLQRISKMLPGDMPDFGPSLSIAKDALKKSKAAVKHIIVISDGDPVQPRQALLTEMKTLGISCTAIQVASHGLTDVATMKLLAKATGGRFYNVKNDQFGRLPEIFIRETRLISRARIYERGQAWRSRPADATEAVAGLPDPPPALKGLVLTVPKPTAELPLLSPYPTDEKTTPLLAHWQFGLGRVAAFTSDIGTRWMVDWPDGKSFGPFWTQLVRFVLRPQESTTLNLSAQQEGDRVRVVVNALSPDGAYIDFLPLKGSVLTPDLKDQNLEFRQTEPGKYEADFPATAEGPYFISTRYDYKDKEGNPQAGFATTGLAVSYPREFLDMRSKREKLEALAQLTGGRVLDYTKLDGVNFFPPTPRRQTDHTSLWPGLLWLAIALLWLDVAWRRLNIRPWALIKAGWNRLRGQKSATTDEAASSALSQLKRKKAELEEQHRQRYTPPPKTARDDDDEPGPPPLPPPGQGVPKPPQPPKTGPTSASGEPKSSGSSYTKRLLGAKKKTWQNRGDGKSP